MAYETVDEVIARAGIRASWGNLVRSNQEDHEDRIAYLETQIGVVSGDDAAPLFVSTTTLTNAQIKALPSTAIQVVAAPDINERIKIVGVTYSFNFQHAAYTNVDTTSAELYLKSSAGTILGGYLVNDGGATVTTLTTLFGQVQRTVDVLPRMTVSGAYLIPVITGTPVNVDGKAVQIFATNNGAGDFTGGHDANRLTVQVLYTVETVPVYTQAFTVFYQQQQEWADQPASSTDAQVELWTPLTLL